MIDEYKQVKVVKAFNDLKVGDLLSYYEDDYSCGYLYTDEIRNEDYSKFISITIDIESVEDLIADGFIKPINASLIEQRNADTVAFIDEQVAKYDAAIKQATEDYDAGLLQPCVKVELETVNYNLIKVLNKVRELLTNE